MIDAPPRRLVRFTAAFAAALSCNGFGDADADTSADAGASLSGSRANIVLVITDDQGYAQLGRHGHPWLRTPSMDRLHDQSVRFDRFLVSPTCAPTRAALMTGRHPMRNGITHTILDRERLAIDAVTLPEVLGKAGYRSGIFGKWHLGDEDAYQPQNRGFDEAFIHGAGGIGQAYGGSCADAPGNRYFDPTVRHNGQFVRTEGFCTDVFFTAAIDWVRAQAEEDRPFFAYVATNAPHGPFLAPDANADRFRALGMEESHAGFYGMIENLDENLGRLMAEIDRLGIADETVLIFMSDNGTVYNGAGEAGAELGRDASGAPLAAFNGRMRGYKGSVEEGGVRVPFFWRGPGASRDGRTIDAVTAHLDLAPTLAQVAGVEFPGDQVEGHSLLPLIEEPDAPWPDRYLFNHVGRWPLGDEPNDHRDKGYAIRGPRFRLVGADRLYDMQADPDQKRNVIDQHPEAVASMTAAYRQWWDATRPLMVNEKKPLAPKRPFHEAYRQQVRDGGIPPWRAIRSND
ncbi:arylsulfatase [Botrimarina hoheduenensis]|uniref:Arylsulfatase n=1 Tax=Botrimarina hoheduenensis TaxID=2528000 RepID=A0A5C5VRV4_9BACT|nr:arylsulfatase [Botrimarina hoheduenensis]TWT40655.1 Arylsulfatase precursor [Botrimarina hoheduenensis]